jgi:zinc transporter, ZIP family
MQNLPEAFNSFGDLINSGFSPNKPLLILVPFSLAGVAATVAGYSLLTGHEQIIVFLMVFPAGTILYLTFFRLYRPTRLRNIQPFPSSLKRP